MNRCMVDVVRPHLHHVPGIDHERSVDRWNIVPATLFMNLQTADIILQQNGQRPRIAMVVYSKFCAARLCNVLAAVKRIFQGIIIQAF